jgi:hypothetical protein
MFARRRITVLTSAIPARAAAAPRALAAALALGLRLALAVGAVAAGTGCGGATSRAADSTDTDAVVTFASDVPDAALWVDGRYVAQLAQLRGGVALSPGSHRLELRHDDYFTQYEQLDLGPRERRRIVVHLAPLLP